MDSFAPSNMFQRENATSERMPVAGQTQGAAGAHVPMLPTNAGIRERDGHVVAVDPERVAQLERDAARWRELYEADQRAKCKYTFGIKTAHHFCNDDGVDWSTLKGKQCLRCFKYAEEILANDYVRMNCPESKRFQDERDAKFKAASSKKYNKQ